MPIEFRCHCGQKIRVSRAAAGKRARCQTCKAIFRIPAESSEEFGATIPLEPAQPARQTQPQSEPGDWLNEFADSESNAAGTGPVVVPQMRTTELDPIEDDVAYRPADPESTKVREDRDWIVPPEKPFWQDMAGSFFFFMDTSNMVTLVIIIVISIIGVAVRYIPLPFVPLIGLALVNGYLCAFYMSTIVETAAGEDELPNIAIDNWLEDAVWPLFRFIGTFALVMVPTLVLIYLNAFHGLQAPGWAISATTWVGAFFWPVVVLVVSIGGGFSGLWPHTVIRTVLAAPLPYLAVCGAVIIAGTIVTAPFSGLADNLIQRFMPIPSARVGFLLFLFMQALAVYAMIVAMRAIGLFYRHFKHKLPWTAE